MIHEGDAECEIIVVEIKINEQIKIRIIAGYGPQECAPSVIREKYRNGIEEQVSRAYLAGSWIVIAEDANAKLGSEIIPNDPHHISENGKLLAGMINRQSLKIVNSSSKCKGGPITRRRIVKGKVEESCIDYIMVSEELERHLLEAIIDKDQIHTLTKFTTTKGKPCVKKSDHLSLIATFNLEYKEKKSTRKEIFKLRDPEGLQKFHEETTNCPKIKNIFRKTQDIEDGCNKWYREIEKLIHHLYTYTHNPSTCTLH